MWAHRLWRSDETRPSQQSENSRTSRFPSDNSKSGAVSWTVRRTKCGEEIIGLLDNRGTGALNSKGDIVLEEICFFFFHLLPTVFVCFHVSSVTSLSCKCQRNLVRVSVVFSLHHRCYRCSPPKMNPVTAWAEGLDGRETILLLNLYLPPAIYSPVGRRALIIAKQCWRHAAHDLSSCILPLAKDALRVSHTHTHVSHTEGRVSALRGKERREIIGGCKRFGDVKMTPRVQLWKV